MSRGMSRGGGGFPIIIAVLGVLILGVIGIFIYMQLNNNSDDALNNDEIETMAPTSATTDIPTVAPATDEPTEEVITLPPSEEPTEEASTEEATATPYVTAAPVYDSATVWINVDALIMHTQANFTSDSVGKIPYGESVSGDKSGKWLNTTYDGVSGWIYLGNTSDGRACVVSSESGLQELEETDADEEDLVSSITKVSCDGDYMTIQIDFSEPVYSDDNGTGDITSSDFTITGGTPSSISSGSAGTEIITIKVQLLSSATEVKITVKSQAIFDASGNAAGSESATLSIT